MNDPAHDADRVARYVAVRVQALAPRRWLQGPRRPALMAADGASDLVHLFATREIYRLPRVVAQAIVAWSRGERRARLVLTTPTAREILGMQARGERCVSLLHDARVPTGDVAGVPKDPFVYGSSGLAFVIHDLCHLEKFAAAELHHEQVGFFAALERALAQPEWIAAAGALDGALQDDVDHISADMNGSCAFLFVVLRNKVKLAVRRCVARERGEACRAGALDDRESALYREATRALTIALGLEGAAREAALELSSRHDAERAGEALRTWFQARGREVLAERPL